MGWYDAPGFYIEERENNEWSVVVSFLALVVGALLAIVLSTRSISSMEGIYSSPYWLSSSSSSSSSSPSSISSKGEQLIAKPMLDLLRPHT